MAEDIMTYEVGDYLLFDNSGRIVGVSDNTDFSDGDNPPAAGLISGYVIALVVERGKDGEITQHPDYETGEPSVS